jgi:single-stranded-DNA-specific exonuclease
MPLTQPQPPAAFCHGSDPFAPRHEATPHWQLKPADPTAVAALTTHFHYPPAIAHLLASRNVTTPAAAEAFLNPSIDQFHNPTQLLGISAAVDRILAALLAAEPILIYGDYDVDGTTATVLLKTTLERIALAIDPAQPAAVSYHVPHRIREGYGMQNAILAEAAAAGIRLVISVDTGIRAIAEAAEARTLGLDLIVTDHHLPNEVGIPDCLAVINPNQPHCPYPNKNLCGAAVAFKLAHALLLAAAPLTADPAAFSPAPTRSSSPRSSNSSPSPPSPTPSLSPEKTAPSPRSASPRSPTLSSPASAPSCASPNSLSTAPQPQPKWASASPRASTPPAAWTSPPTSSSSSSPATPAPKPSPSKLDSLNQARRDSEARALDAIDRTSLTLLDADGAYPADCLILDHPDWHRGVLGILASRVVDRTGRPALVLTHADGNAHGSGRSIPGFHLLDAITAADTGAPTPTAPLFHRFGGHAHAVGFSLPSAASPPPRTHQGLRHLAAHPLAPHPRSSNTTPNSPSPTSLPNSPPGSPAAPPLASATPSQSSSPAT